jgi:5-(carboxyamino)imidazole ribonucleotide mutase
MPKPKVAVLMGSDSDWDTMQSCVEQLKKFDIECEVQVNSAHRTPERVHEFAAAARENGFSVIIAAAGMSAALAGTIAAKTTLPVIGVPVESGPLRGIDALLSTVQMPPGVPVAGVAIGSAGAKNAAILAAQIIGVADREMAGRLADEKQSMAEGVLAKHEKLQKKIKS